MKLYAHVDRKRFGLEPGFNKPAELQTFVLNIPKTEITDDERVIRTYEEILHKIQAVPGVSSVGLATTIPMDGKTALIPSLLRTVLTNQVRLRPCAASNTSRPAFSPPWALLLSPDAT